MLKITDKNGKKIAVLQDEDSEPVWTEEEIEEIEKKAKQLAKDFGISVEDDPKKEGK